MELLAPFASGLSVILLFIAFWLLAQTNEYARRAERKLDVLLKHTGVDLQAVAARDAGSLARSGKKIEAIKLYRDLTGAGLAEAKAAVEK
jgi:ribosomal protein L7/L12